MLYLNKLILISILLLSTAALYANDHKPSNDNQLQEIELKISSAAEKKHQYIANIEDLDSKQNILKHDLNALQKKIELLKTSIKKTIKSEFMMRNTSALSRMTASLEASNSMR